MYEKIGRTEINIIRWNMTKYLYCKLYKLSLKIFDKKYSMLQITFMYLASLYYNDTLRHEWIKKVVDKIIKEYFGSCICNLEDLKVEDLKKYNCEIFKLSELLNYKADDEKDVENINDLALDFTDTFQNDVWIEYLETYELTAEEVDIDDWQDYLYHRAEEEENYFICFQKATITKIYNLFYMYMSKYNDAYEVYEIDEKYVISINSDILSNDDILYGVILLIISSYCQRNYL